MQEDILGDREQIVFSLANDAPPCAPHRRHPSRRRSRGPTKESVMTPTFSIQGRPIGPGYPAYVIAEISANHDQGSKKRSVSSGSPKTRAPTRSSFRRTRRIRSRSGATHRSSATARARSGTARLSTISTARRIRLGTGSRSSRRLPTR